MDSFSDSDFSEDKFEELVAQLACNRKETHEMGDVGWYPHLGEGAFCTMLAPKYLWEIFNSDPVDRQKLATVSCRKKAEQVISQVLSANQYDQLQRLQVETNALIAGLTAVSFVAYPNLKAPFQMFIGLVFARKLVQLMLDANFKFHSNLPEEMRHEDFTKTVWLDLQYSNTKYVDKWPSTPTVNDDLYVANVLHWENDSGHEVKIVVSNTTLMDLVLAMKSTIYFTIITAWDILMAYPRTTMDLNYSLDTTLPQGTQERQLLQAFNGMTFEINPPVTGFDIVVENTEATLLPCWFYDLSTLRVPLLYLELPSNLLLPGSKEYISVQSWQKQFGPNNYLSFVSLPFMHPSLKLCYTLSPTVHAVLSEQQDSIINNASTFNPNVSSIPDLSFVSTLQRLHKEIESPGSPYSNIISKIHTQMATWAYSVSALPAWQVPQVGVSYVAFRILSNLQAGLEDRAMVSFLYIPQ
ncbi:hypothetical protein VNI00_019358 [Paramarasmius palmivorus]|uniref:Uncharacterized protein n=1 Tax=Paramarasmius palmivorus TaxID=297713 RepID=A0AAW0AMH1_9AGAR